MKKVIEELKKRQNVRNNLSQLRKMIKEPAEMEMLKKLLADGMPEISEFLTDEDAKTRKNAALLLGDLQQQAAADAIYQAYCRETTRFVKSSYLQALQKMEVPELIPQLKQHLEELRTQEVTEENRKHQEEEARELNKIIIQYEGISRHKFAPMGKTLDVLLLTNRNLRENICRDIQEKGNVGIEASVHPLGVLVKTSDFTTVSKVRTYRELVFPIPGLAKTPGEPKAAAEELWKAGLYQLLTNLHAPGNDTFYYRVECKSAMELDKRSEFVRKATACLDTVSGGKLVNSPSDYEVEIRLIAMKDGSYFPCVRLYTYRDTRFSYRKNSIATTMAPSTAALIVETAKPYLKENAQIMDPFCGLGTLLIERNRLVPAREIYATDIFGEAITLGRENAELAKTRINFIHRDFFDFRHEYLFDEIITDMPMRGKKTKEEMDALYSAFFSKLPEILAPDAIIILYTNEAAFVKKQLRLHKEYRLLQETNMQKATQTKQAFDLLILQR